MSRNGKFFYVGPQKMAVAVTLEGEDEWIQILEYYDIGTYLTRGFTATMSIFMFDADLGMPTFRAIQRQLNVDLPRSIVRVDGIRTIDPQRVFRGTMFPRLCTQAALAPIIEWLLHAGYVAHESKMPLVITVDHGNVRLQKMLAIRKWDAEDMGHVCIRVWTDIKRQHVKFQSLTWRQ